MNTQQQDPDGQWHRLDPKGIAAVTTLALVPLLPATALMALSGAEGTSVLRTAAVWLGVAALISATTALSWYFTYYRITGQRFELHEGNLSRSHRSIPRERIRSVDLTSRPVHRLLGLSVIKIGTGQQSGDDTEIKLDAVATPHAEMLRRELLRHDTPEATASGEAGSTVPPASGVGSSSDIEIARLRPVWFGYSALTLSFMLVAWGALVSGAGSLSDLLASLGLLSEVSALFTSTPLWAGVLGSLLVLLAVGVLGSLVLSVEMWWAFRLTRERDTTLRVRRGLLTTRSVSLEQRRLRGVELAEPLLLRLVGGMRTNAVATGLKTGGESSQPDRKALLPPAPRAEARRVADEVLCTDRPFANPAPLVTHPRAALRRRLTRALAAPGVLVVGLATAAAATDRVPQWGWIAALSTLPVAAGFAVDAYRNLGHDLDEHYLITRYGTGVRRTVTLQRNGVIGWRIRQSPFQRHSGLITMTATTSAGSGGYKIRDTATGSGLRLAERTVPGLLTPFLEHVRQDE